MRKYDRIDTVSLEAVAIGHKALKALHKSGNEKEVHSVFDRAIYISNGGAEFIKVIQDKEFISPMSILLGNSDDLTLSSIGAKKGTRVLFTKNSLITEDNAVSINLENARVWSRPKLGDKSPILSLEEVTLNLRIVRDVVYTCPSREGLVPLLENVELRGPMKVFLEPQEQSVSEKARPYIEQLMWGLLSGDLGTISERAGSILGLGPGLTPSCDDFLAGLILSLNFAGKAFFKNGEGPAGFFKKVAGEIFRLSKTKTTVYSRSLLSDARYGEGPEAAVNLIEGILTDNPDKTARYARTLVNMGGTSGADMATGIYYGVRFLVSRVETEALYEIA